MASVMAHTLDIATVAALEEGKKVTMVTKQQFLAQLMGAAEQKTQAFGKAAITTALQTL